VCAENSSHVDDRATLLRLPGLAFGIPSLGMWKKRRNATQRLPLPTGSRQARPHPVMRCMPSSDPAAISLISRWESIIIIACSPTAKSICRHHIAGYDFAFRLRTRSFFCKRPSSWCFANGLWCGLPIACPTSVVSVERDQGTPWIVETFVATPLRRPRTPLETWRSFPGAVLRSMISRSSQSLSS
jgi:hypothetical protein